MSFRISAILASDAGGYGREELIGGLVELLGRRSRRRSIGEIRFYLLAKSKDIPRALTRSDHAVAYHKRDDVLQDGHSRYQLGFLVRGCRGHY